jgi:hypothetical protein
MPVRFGSPQGNVDNYPVITFDAPSKKDEDALHLSIHPDGPQVDDPIMMSFRVETVQRVSRTITMLQRQRDAGTLDQRQYDELFSQLGQAKDENTAELIRKRDAGEITNQVCSEQLDLADKMFRESIDSLDEQRTGKLLTPEEFNKLTARIEQWRASCDTRAIAAGYIRATVFKWDNYADEATMKAGGDPLPISDEVLLPLGEMVLISMMNRIRDYYALRDAEGKGSSENSGDTLVAKETKEASLISTSTMLSPSDTTPEAQPTLSSGANESSVKPS